MTLLRISNDLTQMVNSPTWTHSPALLDLFLSSDASICSAIAFPPLGNSDHVVISVSIDFPSNSQRDAPFHRIAYDYSCADWDGLHDHLRNVPWNDIFKLGASAAASKFYEWVQVGIDVCIFIENIRSSAAAIVHRNHFFVCTKRFKSKVSTGY